MRYTPREFIEKLNDLWTKYPDLTIGNWRDLDLRAGGKKLRILITKKEPSDKKSRELERAIMDGINYERLGCFNLLPLSSNMQLQDDGSLKVDWCLHHFHYMNGCLNHDVLDSELMFNASEAGFRGTVNATVHDEGSTRSTSYELIVK